MPTGIITLIVIIGAIAFIALVLKTDIPDKLGAKATRREYTPDGDVGRKLTDDDA